MMTSDSINRREILPNHKPRIQGITAIKNKFLDLAQSEHTALMPYFTLGFPTPDLSLDIIEAIAQNGADLLELGIPFSDPLADGVTIQQSTQTALEQHVTPKRCLRMVAQLRMRGIRQPILLMGYYNPILSYGLEAFVRDSHEAGVDGYIVPDLPPDEAGELQKLCIERDLALVFLVSPNTNPDRLKYVASQSQGFLYLVSLMGVTGAREQLADDLEIFIKKVRKTTELPLAVGFGISTPSQAESVGFIADGVIVGSALIKQVANAEDPIMAAVTFVSTLHKRLRGQAG